MESYPSFPEVCEQIGEKPVVAFAKSVQRSKADFHLYRATFPPWVAAATPRGLANWINDRLWDHMGNLAEGIPGMDVVESGPLREAIIGVNYRFRMKRHDHLGDVASYPTEAFLDFVCQPQYQLPGFEETRLIAGYEWLKDLNDIGQAVFSLRDGKDNIIWMEPLPEVEDDWGGTSVAVTSPTPDQPTRPTVEIPASVGRQQEDETEK